MSATGWVACGLALAFMAAAIVIWITLAALTPRSLQPLALAAAIVSGCARADQSPGAGMPSWSLGICAGLRASGAIDQRDGAGLQRPLAGRTRLPQPEDHRSRNTANPSLDRAAGARPCLPVHARLSRRVAFAASPGAAAVPRHRACLRKEKAPRQSPAPRRRTLPRPRRRPNALPMVNVS